VIEWSTAVIRIYGMTVHAAQTALRSPKSAHFFFRQKQLTTPNYEINIQHGNTRTVIPPQILTGRTPLGAPSLLTPLAQMLSFKKGSQISANNYRIASYISQYEKV